MQTKVMIWSHGGAMTECSNSCPAMGLRSQLAYAELRGIMPCNA